MSGLLPDAERAGEAPRADPIGSAPDGARGRGPMAPVAIEPGDEAPGQKVAGLPMILRLSRQLERGGAGGLLIVTPQGGERWRELLERSGCRLPVEEARVCKGACLDGGALYDPSAISAWVAELAEGRSPEPPGPIVEARTRSGRRRAEEEIYRSIRKSLAHDGPVSFFLARPMSRPLTRALARLGVSANAVTLAGLGVGIGAGLVAALGGYWASLGAALLFFAGLLIDCVDGDLARITLSTSRLGQWLDSLTDDLGYVALAVGLGVGLGPPWLWLGLVTLGLVSAGQGVIYRWLAKSGGPIDTARYPWFFMGRGGLAQGGERSIGGWLSFAVRRDSLTLIFLVLAALGLPEGILVLLGAGSAAYGALLVADLTFKARREPGEERNP
ncbi:MAG: CDP-alcohol phosphatidyltransferase family protein [Polyangia bacterium]|nr:CDP-alcohol phosphatidyltransferase family protein [Polyangia bacterium]